ncbi:unnamed protein product, partial [Larinioides sclopetarius]
MKLTRFLKEKHLQYYTMIPKWDRPIKVVIRDLPRDTRPQTIKDFLETFYGFKVDKVVHLTKLRTKRPLPLFQVTLPNEDKNKEIWSITNVCYMKVEIQRFQRRSGTLQCFNCNLYHHAAATCQINPRCLNCGYAHSQLQCTKVFALNQEVVPIPPGMVILEEMVYILTEEAMRSLPTVLEDHSSPVFPQGKRYEFRCLKVISLHCVGDAFHLDSSEFPALPSVSSSNGRSALSQPALVMPASGIKQDQHKPTVQISLPTAFSGRPVPGPPQVVLGKFIYKTALPGFQCKQDLARPAFPQKQKFTRATLPSKQDVSHPTYLLKQQYSKLGSTPPPSSPCASLPLSVPLSAPPPLSVPLSSQPPLSVPQSSPPSLSVPLSSPPPLSVPQSSPPPLSVPLSSPPPLSVPLSSPPPLSVLLSSPPSLSVPQSSPPPLSVPLSSRPPISVLQSSPPSLSVPLSSPPPLSVPKSSPPPLSVPLSSPPPLSVLLSSPPPLSVPLSSRPPISVPQSSPPSLSVPRSSPPPLSVPLSSPPPLSVPLSSPPLSVLLSSPPSLSVPQSSPPPLSVPLSSRPPLSVPLSAPPPLSVPLSAPPPLSVPQSSPPLPIPDLMLPSIYAIPRSVPSSTHVGPVSPSPFVPLSIPQVAASFDTFLKPKKAESMEVSLNKSQRVSRGKNIITYSVPTSNKFEILSANSDMLGETNGGGPKNCPYSKKCDSCGKIYSSPSSFSHHLKRFKCLPTIRNSYPRLCELCLKTYGNKCSFWKHLKQCCKSTDNVILTTLAKNCSNLEIDNIHKAESAVKPTMDLETQRETNLDFSNKLLKSKSAKQDQIQYPRLCEICLKSYSSRSSFCNHLKHCSKSEFETSPFFSESSESSLDSNNLPRVESVVTSNVHVETIKYIYPSNIDKTLSTNEKNFPKKCFECG